MIRKLLFAAPILLTALAGSAQVEFRVADQIRLGELRSALSDNNRRLLPGSAVSPLLADLDEASENVQVIIRYDSESALDAIRNRGGEIVSLVGTRTAIGSVPVDKAADVAAAEGVRGAKLSVKLKHTNMKALPFSHVNDVHQGNGLDMPYDGTGVIVGLYDSGIDPNHINFCDENGDPRIKLFLGYPQRASAVPEICDTPQKIRDFTSDDKEESHGTHVLGIISGSFNDSSDPDAPDYRGVAPGAEIFAAGGPGYEVQILDAAERFGQYVREQGKPGVFNLSFGDNVGPHDGSDEFTEALNDIAEKYDLVVCLSAGNERDTPISIIKELTDQDPYVKTLALKGPESSYVGSYFQCYSPVEIWGEDDTPFEVSLDIVDITNDGEVVYSFGVPTEKAAYVAQGSNISNYVDTSNAEIIRSGTDFQNIYSNSFMGGICGVNGYNNRYTAQLAMFLNAKSYTYARKNFVRITVKGVPGKKIFMYCDGTYMNLGNNGIQGLDVPDGAGTNSNMASGPNTLCVGSYVTANVDGSGYPDGTIGDVSYFSSYGETPDGRTMPDICTPGQVIISSRNTHMSRYGEALYYWPIEYTYTDKGKLKSYYWTPCAGTSQASPHMAGIAALWRQANPNLSYSQIIDIARQTATEPEFSSVGWGHGKVDALAGVKKSLMTSDIATLPADSPEALMIMNNGGATFDIFSPAQDRLSAAIYSLQGVKIMQSRADNGTLTIDASTLQPGVYVLKANSTAATRTLKFKVGN